MSLKPLSQDTNFPRPFNENYELLGVLGQGGMGHVYKAKDNRLDRIVALKVLESSSNAESIARFKLEAQTMKELDHQNIVHVFDFGEEKKELFIAMTYVEGKALSDVLRNKSKLDFNAIELIAKQIARALLFAHSKGIVHRDVKPSNIMLTHDNRVYLMDFGISYVREMEQERLTMTGMTMGTPEYMSPEQCRGDEVGEQSDIYSLGVILYEMTCGQLPFSGTKPIEIAMKHVQEPPPAPETFRANTPTAISKFILKCLQKKPEDRFKDMEDFLDAFDDAFNQAREATRRNQASRVRNRPLTFRPQDIAQNVLNLLPIQKKLAVSCLFMFPLIVVLMIALMLLHKPSHTLRELNAPQVHGNFEQTSIEADIKEYPPENLFDGKITTAWIFKAPSNSKNPILTMNFKDKTLITNIGIAIGYQKSADDNIGDRYGIFNKPRTLSIRTKEGFKQDLSLDDVKGMQYPRMTPIETTEIQVFLGKTYITDADKPLAISEIRMLGMNLE